MMKKTIKALKESGIYDKIVKSVIDTRKRTGFRNNSTKGIKTILKMEFNRNEALFDIFFNESLNGSLNDIADEIMNTVEETNTGDEPDMDFAEHCCGCTKEDEVVGKFLDFLNAIAESYTEE